MELLERVFCFVDLNSVNEAICKNSALAENSDITMKQPEKEPSPNKPTSFRSSIEPNLEPLSLETVFENTVADTQAGPQRGALSEYNQQMVDAVAHCIAESMSHRV